jgi:hypothetical protein
VLAIVDINRHLDRIVETTVLEVMASVEGINGSSKLGDPMPPDWVECLPQVSNHE